MLNEETHSRTHLGFKERKLSVISHDVLTDLGMTPGQIKAYGAFGSGPTRRSTDEDRRGGYSRLA